MWTCNWAGPSGAFPGQALPISSALAPLWSTWITVVDAHSWVVLQMGTAPPPRQMDELTWWSWARSPRPPGASGLILWPLWHHPAASPSANQRIVRERIAYPATPHPPNSWPLKRLCWNPSGSSRLFQGKSHLVSLRGPAINPSLLHTPKFWFVWLHCASGTWTCANSNAASSHCLVPSRNLILF